MSIKCKFENSYFALGARQYDAETGRFLSIDPLFEQFSANTPYHYAFNSPVQWKDPSGLYPEDEKGERVQASLTLWDLFGMPYIYQIRNRSVEEMRSDEYWQMDYDIFLGRDNPTRLFNEFMASYYASAVGGGGSGNDGTGRTSNNKAKNGSTKKTDSKNEPQQSEGGDEKAKKKGDSKTNYGTMIFGPMVLELEKHVFENLVSDLQKNPNQAIQTLAKLGVKGLTFAGYYATVYGLYESINNFKNGSRSSYDIIITFGDIGSQVIGYAPGGIYITLSWMGAKQGVIYTSKSLSESWTPGLYNWINSMVIQSIRR